MDAGYSNPASSLILFYFLRLHCSGRLFHRCVGIDFMGHGLMNPRDHSLSPLFSPRIGARVHLPQDDEHLFVFSRRPQQGLGSFGWMASRHFPQMVRAPTMANEMPHHIGAIVMMSRERLVGQLLRP
jgi:hypothetical protein